MNDHVHVPVMTAEVLANSLHQKGDWIIDGTFGRGGHTRAFLESGARVIAFDVDQEASEYAQVHFEKEIANTQLFFIRENFTELQSSINQLKSQVAIPAITTVFFDFGTSTNQLMSAERGFSFQDDGPLDMRMDNRLNVTAADLLAVIPENQLAELFAVQGGEPFAKKIARVIKKRLPITHTNQLVSIITSIKGRRGKLHPATQVFQALRIAVNLELSNIEQALPQALRLLKPGGRLITIAFHEGEDALVKHFCTQAEAQGLGTKITKKPLTPSPEEREQNPRSRSAKLRILEKL